MVIADNHVNALAIGISNLFHRLDAAVQRDNQSTPLLRSIIYSLLRYTISFGVAVWDVVVDCG